MSLSSIMKDWIVAFQADDSNLSIIQGENLSVSNLMLGMMPGTSPSVDLTNNGDPFIAFQANTSDLWIWTEQGALDTKLGMMPGTSPAATNAWGWGNVVAFQANTGNLWFWTEQGATDTKLGMMRGTNPSIYPGDQGSFGIVFQNNTNNLWSYYPYGSVGQDMKLGMMPGASPVVSRDSSYMSFFPEDRLPQNWIAFEANSGNLWLSSGYVNDGFDTKLGIMRGSNPSILVAKTAFQSPQGSLWVADGLNGQDLKLGMLQGTSPAISFKGASFDDYYIAFQANTGNLWVTLAHPNSGFDTGLKMMAGTSPAVPAARVGSRRF